MAITKVTTEVITTSAVTTPTIADNAISAAKIPDGTIATGHIADNAVTAAKIPDNVLTATMLPDNVILATHIPNATALTLGATTLGGDLTMGSNQIIFNNNSQAIQIKDTAGTASYVLYQDNADTLVVANGTNVEKIRLDTGGNEGALVIDTDGKVLIGTQEVATKGKAIIMAMVFG